MKASRANAADLPPSSGGGGSVAASSRGPSVHSGDSALRCIGPHLQAPPTRTLAPRRPTPSPPEAATPPGGERMLGIEDIVLRTPPTRLPPPQRPAPPVPTAALGPAHEPMREIEAPYPALGWRPPPLSLARLLVAEPADAEWHTPLNSPSQLASPTSPSLLTLPTALALSFSLSPPSIPTSPSSLSSPSWPAAPQDCTPVESRCDAKWPMLLAPPASDGASTSAAPAGAGPAWPDTGAWDRAEWLAQHIEGLRMLTIPAFFHQPHADRDALNGDLGGVGPVRLAKLHAAAGADIACAWEPQRRLETQFNEIRDDVVRERGGAPSLLTQRAGSRQKADARHAAEIAAQYEAMDAGDGYS